MTLLILSDGIVIGSKCINLRHTFLLRFSSRFPKLEPFVVEVYVPWRYYFLDFCEKISYELILFLSFPLFLSRHNAKNVNENSNKEETFLKLLMDR